jgi:hypothetical protein
MKKSFAIVLLFLATFGYSQNWKTNFEDAKKRGS